MRRQFAWVSAICLAACSSNASSDATLYRSSPVDPSLRVYVALFEEESGTTVNLDNCEMIARVLNANLDALAKVQNKQPDGELGYWCEPGRFNKEGNVPQVFDRQFPTQ